MAVGRISGPLLKDNLIRNGINLSFETDLLYLDVNNNRVGINNSNPQYDLDVTGTSRITDIIVSGNLRVADITLSGNTIQSDQGVINLGTNDDVIYQKTALIDDLKFEYNTISTTASNANLELRTNGTGRVEVYADVNVSGNIHATGNITADGDIVLGDQNTDTIQFNAEIASDIIPDQDGTYDIGSSSRTWANIWVTNFNASNVSAGSLVANGVDLTLRQGNIYYVAENGDDSYTGDHPQDPFASLSFALSQASSGDTIHIFPGTYTETFPLTVPVGVSIKGHNLRAVTIQPTVGTNDQDAFLLNGETTIEDLTITGFYYDGVGNTGHAFRFATNALVSTRSPYIRNVSVITEGSVTTSEDPRGFNQGDAGRGVYADGSVINSSSNEASLLFHSVTFICPGVDTVTATNGVRIEWLNCFTYFADKAVYALDGTGGKYNDGKTRLRVDNLNGSFAQGETISFYDTDGVTLLASGTIETKEADGKIVIDGNSSGFLDPSRRISKIVNINDNASISTTQSKFGSSSLALDGTDDNIFINSNDDFGFGTGDFTVELWIYSTAMSGTRALLDFRAATATDNGLYLYTSSARPSVYINGSAVLASPDALSNNTWYHIAVTRNSGTMKLFVNGVEKDSDTVTTDLGSNKPLFVGANYDASAAFWNGYFDDIRIIKGVAEYTAAFTAPTFQVSVTPETVLMLRFDGDNGSTVIEEDEFYAQDIRFSGSATATKFTLVDYRDFGAEIRMIGSACVYGNYGLYGDGPGVLVYAIGQNLAYIGNGKEYTNDPTTTIQANEVVELNNAKIRYSSVDHKGDFRVGDLFHINQQTGEVNFASTALNLDLSQGLTLTDGVNTTTINGTKIETGNIRISGNTIETLTGDLNLDSATANIVLVDNVQMQQDLTVEGLLTLNSNLVIGNSPADSVTINARISSDLVPNTSNTYDLGATNLLWKNLYVNFIDIDDIQINNNYITTTASNADLELRANGTGRVVVPLNDVEFGKKLDVLGDTTLSDTTVNGTLTVNGEVNQTGNITVNGSVVVTGNFTVDSEAQFENIKISGNVITTTLSNSNLELRANGTGTVYIPNDNLEVTNDATVLGTITANEVIPSTTVTANSFATDNIFIKDNYITTTDSNSNLELRTSGTGFIVFEDLSINNSTISSSNTIVLDSAAESVTIQSTGSLKLPNGTSLQRDNSAGAGQIRYNTDLSRFEGYNGVNWFNLVGVEDIDGNTKITAELTPGSNDNTIRFYVDGSIKATLTDNNFDIPQLQVDSININNNVISTTVLNDDLIFSANGTGAVVIENFAFSEETITNTVSDSITVIENTGTGYTQFTGTTGVVIPVGDTASRFNVATGMMRFNTDDVRVEIYNGTTWVAISGLTGGINLSTAQDNAIGMALIAG